MPKTCQKSAVYELEGSKRCLKCGQLFGLSAVNFYRQPCNRDGFAGVCKKCVSFLRRQRYFRESGKQAIFIESVGAEQWRDVVGLEGWYQISNFGRVRNKYGRILKDHPCHFARTQKDKKLYRQITLHRKTVRTICRIHRLVAAAFLGPSPSTDAEVHHKTDQNNHANNLEWLTPEQHSARHGRRHRLSLKKFLNENLCPCCSLKIKEFLKP